MIIALAMWAPVVANLLDLGALLLLLPTLCTDRRVVWTAAWLFFLGNWVGQDYFSPQAMAYFLHLVVLALLLGYFRRRSARSGPIDSAGDARQPAGALDDRRLAIAVGLTILSLAVTNISSHQLTPAMMLCADGVHIPAKK